MDLEILLYLLAIRDLDNAECQAQFADVGRNWERFGCFQSHEDGVLTDCCFWQLKVGF